MTSTIYSNHQLPDETIATLHESANGTLHSVTLFAPEVGQRITLDSRSVAALVDLVKGLL